MRSCRRDGCDQPVSTIKPGDRYCGFACRAVDSELKAARRVCEAIGPASSASSELWVAAVAVNDALSEYLRLDRELLNLARSVGFSNSDWHNLKNPTRRAPEALSHIGTHHETGFSTRRTAEVLAEADQGIRTDCARYRVAVRELQTELAELKAAEQVQL